MRRRLLPAVALAPAAVAALLSFASGGTPLQATLLAGGVSVAALLAGILATRKPLRALLDIASAVRRRAGGDLLARAQSEGDDELGLLAHHFNHAANVWTERIQRLRDESATLLAVLDGMSEGVWVTDVDGNVIRHNLALKELLYAGQELIGKRPLAILRSNELSDAVMRACQRGESSSLEISVEGVRPRVLEVHVAPLRDIGGSAAVFHDVTELRRLEKVRKDFVANVSHELRTPITAIRGYAETLKDGALKDAQHAPGMVDIIYRQSERLSELVEDLLELSRLEAKELQLDLVDVNLADAARRALDVVRQRAEAKGIQLSVQLDETLTAKGDDRAVEQVLLNLFDNAVKYTPARGRVEVTGERRDGRVFMAIKDTGVGIEEKHLPRVFERFYRVDKGRSRDMGGTGLGLSIVKHLMTAMQGEVTVQSRPGAGSTFTISLPVTSSLAERPSKAPM